MEIFIANLFDNQYGGTYPEFITKIDKITQEVFGNKIKQITDQGSSFYRDLKQVFTENIGNLLKTMPITLDGQPEKCFQLSLGGYVTTLFETDENGNSIILSRDLLPSNAKYVKEIINGEAILGDLTGTKLQELRIKGTLFVAHDESKNFIVVEREMEKTLPSNLIEGYYHAGSDQYKDKVFNNVMLNLNDILLFGRVSFKGSGEIEILTEDWYKAYFPNHISRTSQYSKLNSLLTNTPGSTVDTFTAEYITVIGIVSGSNYISVMQRTKTNIYPTAPYSPYIPWMTGKEGSSKDTLTYESPSEQELQQMYGIEFIEDFNDIFTSLLILEPDYSRKDYQYAITKALKHLDKLNRHFEGLNFDNFIPGPNGDQINTRINELYRNPDGSFDEEGFLRFLLKNPDGSFKKFLDPTTKYSQKMWLSDILNRILVYDGDEPSLKNARETLEHFGSLPEYAASLDCVLNPEEYTEQEANLAQELFKSIQDVFGHFTVRLTFGNMLDYYYKGDGVKIKILKRPYLILESFNHIKFKSPTRKARTASMEHNVMQYKLQSLHCFGYFFLDSALELKLDSGEIRYAFCNYGPLVNLGSGRIVGVETSRYTSLRKFSQAIGERFAVSYESQNTKKSVLQIAGEFIETQSVLYTELKKVIITRISNLYQDKVIEKNEKRLLTDRLLRKLRKDMSYTRFSSTTSQSSIGAQIINFLSDSHSDSTLIKFWGISDPGREGGSFRIRVTMDQLLSIKDYDISLQGILSTKKKSDYFSFIKRHYLLRDSKNVANEMKKMILSQNINDATGGKVRFYPIMDIENNVGNQFLLASHADNSYEYLPLGNDVTREGGYFEVDFSNPTSDDIHILEHIALMMHTGKLSFIMTKADDGMVTIENAAGGNTRKFFIHEMICAFNREGFLDPSEIFSESVPGDANEYLSDGTTPYQIIFPECFHLSVPGYNFNSHQLFDESKPENLLMFTINGDEPDMLDMQWYINEINAGRRPYSSKIRNALGI